MKRLYFALALVVALLVSPACAGKNVPILVAQSAVAATSSLEQLSNAGKKLQEAAVLPTAIALGFQQKLLLVNDKLKPLPDILRTIDSLQVAGSSTANDTDRAIAILTVVGQEISVVIGGVPISDATTALIDLIRAAQKTIQDILIGVAQIQGRES